ncbi:tyramine beta-hydroxylase, partial [Biomphalaria glabrata]
HNPPIQVLPGDELKATCVYNSVSSSHYVYFGESTQEEMCVMFLTVYPAKAIKAN